MELQLKDVYVTGRSDVGLPIYNARIDINGRCVGAVSDDGSGKPWFRWVESDAEAEAVEHCRGMPPVSDGDGAEVPMDLNLWCRCEVERHVDLTELRVKLANHTLIFHEGTIYECDSDMPRSKVAADMPGAVVLNDLPEDRALAIFVGEVGVDGPGRVEPLTDAEREAFEEAFETGDEELAAQQNRVVESRVSGWENAAPGESDEEANARRERNNERLAARDPQLRAVLDRVREESRKRQDASADVHPGSRLKSPSARWEKPAAEVAKVEATGAQKGSLREKLRSMGIKAVKNKKRKAVGDLICAADPAVGISTSMLADQAGVTAHDVGNHIYHLKHENGYRIDFHSEGKVRRYFGRPPTAEEIEASRSGAGAATEESKEEAA